VSRAKALAVLVPAALALIAGVAVADSTPSVTIVTPKQGQNISRSRVQYFVASGKSTFATPSQASTNFYLRRDGCGTSSDNPHLSVTTGTDAGTGCGFVGGNGFVSDVSPSLFSVNYPSIDGMPLTLDSSRPIQGVLDLRNAAAGIGRVTLDFTAEALVNGNGIVVGTDSENVLVTPAASDYPVTFTITPTAQLDKVDLSGIDLNVYIHGAYSDSGYIRNSGASYMTVPSWTASLHRSVLLSVDDPTFAAPITSTLDSSNANWYTAVPTPQTLGKHTFYAEAVQGFNTSAVAVRSFNVTK
jgi:hypothetical protein